MSGAFRAPVAQLDRASDSGSEGWGFESLRAYQLALTKKMQAKIPHFGAGFLHIKSKN